MPKLYVSNKDESARLFKSDFLEMFTHVHWSVPLIIYVPVSGFFMYRAIHQAVLGAGEIALLFLFGLFIWTITEYVLHRFAFHYEPKSEWGKRIHFLTHGVHHDYPQDTKRLVMPPSVSIPLASFFFGLFYVLIGPYSVAPFFSGFLVGYMAYDELHYATHHAPFKSGIFLKLKHHHILHHYGNPSKGYGVSSPLWDLILGTMDKKERESKAAA